MYYSRDLIVVKYNEFDLKFGEYKSGDEYNTKWKNVEYEDVEDYTGLIPNEYLTLWRALPEDKTVEDWLEIYEGVLGKWMLVEVDEDFDEEEFMEEIEDADEDELVDLLTDYIVMINAVQFSSQASQQIGDVTAQNVTYLNKLANFIVTNYEENFEEDNGRYEMDDSEEVCQAYAAVFGIPHPMYYI